MNSTVAVTLKLSVSPPYTCKEEGGTVLANCPGHTALLSSLTGSRVMTVLLKSLVRFVT